MTNATQKLHSTLQTEQLDTLLFIGKTPVENKLARVFGGQVLAQSLSAAIRTVPAERLMHSIHAYFMRPGDISYPIIFEVDPIRDGGSFNTRNVVAKQYGKAILSASISFKAPEQGLSHSDIIPDVPAPETLQNDTERLQELRREHPNLPSINRGDAYQCFDIRTVGDIPYLCEKGHAPVQGFWFKPKHRLEADFSAHQAFLAYVSDMRLLMASILPHGVQNIDDNLIVASLDHSMWIHDSFDINEWHYYHMTGPVSSGGCGLNFGQFFNRKGKLVASASQEGLMRLKAQ